ncbi:MAG: hypothetical protein WAY93_10200 [Atopobiaceae bacterium]|jgi:hypothetical protein|nr:hypothetical protein [Atopobiaceae bacterium]
MSKKRQRAMTPEGLQRLRAARSTRFLFVRYSTAILTFLDIFWFGLLAVLESPMCLLPLAAVVFSVVAVVEQTRALDRDDDVMPITELYAEATLLGDGLVAATTIVLGSNVLFPFLASLPVALAAVGIAAALRAALLAKLRRISKHTDRGYGYWAEVAASIK